MFEALEQSPASAVSVVARTTLLPASSPDLVVVTTDRLRWWSNRSRSLAAFGVTGHSHRERQAGRLRSSAARLIGSNSGSRRAAGRFGRSRRAYSRLIVSRRLIRACTLSEAALRH